MMSILCRSYSTFDCLVFTYANKFGFRYELRIYLSPRGAILELSNDRRIERTSPHAELIVWSSLARAKVKSELLEPGMFELLKAIFRFLRSRMNDEMLELDDIASAFMVGMDTAGLMATLRTEPILGLMMLAEGLGMDLSDMWGAIDGQSDPGS